jgi:hypothetical protein
MANKTKATPQKEEAREKGPEILDARLPLLDLSDAAVGLQVVASLNQQRRWC